MIIEIVLLVAIVVMSYITAYRFGEMMGIRWCTKCLKDLEKELERK